MALCPHCRQQVDTDSVHAVRVRSLHQWVFFCDDAHFCAEISVLNLYLSEHPNHQQTQRLLSIYKREYNARMAHYSRTRRTIAERLA